MLSLTSAAYNNRTNALDKNLRHGFLVKRVKKGIRNNLELLSFQKMYGLWGYLLKAKALAPINARRVLEGG